MHVINVVYYVNSLFANSVIDPVTRYTYVSNGIEPNNWQNETL